MTAEEKDWSKQPRKQSFSALTNHCILKTCNSTNHCITKTCDNLMISSVRILVLIVLCAQNSIYTVLRRYSLGTLKEKYNKYEVLLVAEIIKIIFSAYMISKLPEYEQDLTKKLKWLAIRSKKMFMLAAMYGAMNVLSFVSLKNIGAGMFTVFAQLKIITTAGFSAVILGRRYSMPRWRALVSLMLGVLLFSEPVWNTSEEHPKDTNMAIGVTAVLIEVSLSGFSSIYFEKVIKTDNNQKLGIWERNFQLSLWSFPLYIIFIFFGSGDDYPIGAHWSMTAFMLSILGATGGLLVALSIKYGDSILKTLATTAAIILSSVLDHFWLGGPLTPIMNIATCQVIIAICNYTFNKTPVEKVKTDKDNIDKTPLEVDANMDDDIPLASKDPEEQELLLLSPTKTVTPV